MKHKLILSALFCGAALFAETPVEFKVQPQMSMRMKLLFYIIYKK